MQGWLFGYGTVLLTILLLKAITVLTGMIISPSISAHFFIVNCSRLSSFTVLTVKLKADTQ